MARLARYHGAKAAWVLASWTDTWLDPSFADWSIDAALAEVTTPVLAIHGELDEYGTMAHAERIARLARGRARVVALPGIHHVPHREAEAEVLDLVAGFLRPVA
jgi:pimeloyl-ACP methyl ester carboxylesterase